MDLETLETDVDALNDDDEFSVLNFDSPSRTEEGAVAAAVAEDMLENDEDDSFSSVPLETQEPRARPPDVNTAATATASATDTTATSTAAASPTTASASTSFARFRQKRRTFGSVEKSAINATAAGVDSIGYSPHLANTEDGSNAMERPFQDPDHRDDDEDDDDNASSGLFDVQSTDSASPFHEEEKEEQQQQQVDDDGVTPVGVPAVVAAPSSEAGHHRDIHNDTSNDDDDDHDDDDEEEVEFEFEDQPSAMVEATPQPDQPSRHAPSSNKAKAGDILAALENVSTVDMMEDIEDGSKQEEDKENEEQALESSEEANTNIPTTAPAEAEQTQVPKERTQPDNQSLIKSTDELFLQVTDRTKVTVKDILQSLQTEYDWPKFDKASKAVVRERLTALILGQVQPLQQSDNDESEESDQGADSESEASVSDQEADDDSSDFEDAKPRPKKSRSKKASSLKSKHKSQAEKRGRVKRKSAAAVKAAAVRVQAEQLRKKRLEELRVRNEELQLLQNQEEQKRAASIAAKLETDTEEVRLARLEQRLDLLQKLDQKRFTVIQEAPVVATEPEKEDDPDELFVNEASDDAEEDESSEDEMELEIIGQPSKTLNPLRPNALSLLSWADKGMPAPVQKKNTTNNVSRATIEEASTEKFLSLLQQAKLNRNSPGQSLSARAFLKKRLLSRQRRMGNQWLARELGYQNERDHMQDCLKVEHQKRLVSLKQEQERIEANERRMLRERWVKAEDNPIPPDGDDDNDTEDEEYKEPGQDASATLGPAIEGEDDDEVAMALELKQIDPEDSVTSPRMETPDDSQDHDLETREAVAPADEDGSVGEAPPSTSTVLPMTAAELQTVSNDAPEESVVVREDLTLTESTVTSTDEDEGPVVMALSDMDVGATISAEKTSDELDNTVEKEESQPDIDDDSVQFETQPASLPAPTEAVEPKEGQEEVEQEQVDENLDKPKGPRNSAWREMLKREAEKAKKQKKRSGEMIDDQAEEEEEEEILGLEDFGFAMHKKKKAGEDDENEEEDAPDDDDMDDVVDDVSVGEGDEEAGEEARKEMELKEEKERHREIMRRMREGYDGRRGGIAGGGAGARGVHRFDQLVAADNREDAKRLGLLNDDELDSDEENEKKGDDDEEEDEAAYLDKMLKDRFLHRSSIDLEENFSEDEDNEDQNANVITSRNDEDLEEQEQERMARRFTKRARMQRIIETYGKEEEFSQLKLIEEDTTLKEELSKMKNGLVRKRSHSNSLLSNDNSRMGANGSKRQKVGTAAFAPTWDGSSLAIALQASRGKQNRTSFLRDTFTGSSETTASFQRSIGFKHVVFQSSSSMAASRGSNSQSQSSFLPSTSTSGFSKSSSLWTNVSRGFQKRH